VDDTWTVIQSMNAPRYAHVACVAFDALYVIGG